MSRSTYIYTVQDDEGVVIGAFTVKHELKTALEKHWEIEGLVRVTRTRDGEIGPRAQRVEMNPITLEVAT